METLNIVLIKLGNGENIICETLETPDSFVDKPFIEIFNPVMLNVVRIPRASSLIESYMMLPWFGVSTADSCRISVDKIITIVDVKDEVQENYLEFIAKSSDDSEESNSSSELSVSFEDSPNEVGMEIEEFLENVIEKIGEQIEEEDEDYDGRDDSSFRRIRRSTRTLH